MATRFSMRGAIGMLRITQPPVNSLGLAVRQGIASGLAEAEKAGAKAIVLSGDGATFPAGADITEFATGAFMTTPSLLDNIADLEKSKIPIVAAIHGTALGGGAELTFACHYRVMDERARIGLPEVHLGLLPGAGGTQRLPRLVGCETAIKMMTSGMPINAKKALAAGVVDEVAPADGKSPAADSVVERAVAFAEALGGAPADPSRVLSNQPVPPVPDGFFDTARHVTRAMLCRIVLCRIAASCILSVAPLHRDGRRLQARGQTKKAARGMVAPLSIVDAVAAAASAPSFAAGLAEEARLFAGLARGPQARRSSLRMMAFGEPSSRGSSSRASLSRRRRRCSTSSSRSGRSARSRASWAAARPPRWPPPPSSARERWEAASPCASRTRG